MGGTGSMTKLGFLVRFLAGFAAFLTLWGLTPIAEWSKEFVLGIAGTMGPAIHGWVLLDAVGNAQFPVWQRGTATVELRIQFDALTIGLVPFAALIAATPRVSWTARVTMGILGSALCLAIDILIVTLFPLLVHYENPVTGIGGTFLGLVGFVGAPVIVWFGLVHRELGPWLPSLQKKERGQHGAPSFAQLPRRHRD